MCGVRVQVLAFSPSGNPYSFISPSSSSSSSTQQADQFSLSSQQEDDLSRQASELKAKLETLKRKNENLKACLKETADLDKADLTQLLAMKENLQRALGIWGCQHGSCFSWCCTSTRYGLMVPVYGYVSHCALLLFLCRWHFSLLCSHC